MKKVVLFSLLLIIGLICSQATAYFNEPLRMIVDEILKNLTLIFLGFIMIHVGLEFTIDQTKLKSYAWDYFVAFTAAAFPWIFCTLYFYYGFSHNPEASNHDLFYETLMLGRFASPTSAGVLFTMLAAAGLASTWVFNKARILAIFDDLDTILLLVPIKMLLIGFKWELIILLFIIGGLIYLAWKKMHLLKMPINWYWILTYAILITAICEAIYRVTYALEDVMPLHIEILLPAFALGCILAHPKGVPLHEFLEEKRESTVQFFIAAAFMFLVGASMPVLDQKTLASLSYQNLALDALILTVLSNLGKLFPLFCYQKEASRKERLALSIAMFPRGEVGAGIIVISLSVLKHLDNELIVAALLSLVLNLFLTGVFILWVKKLLAKDDPKCHESI